MAGIFTVQGLRGHVVAKGMALGRPIRDAMAPRPQTLPEESALVEAMAMATSASFHGDAHGLQHQWLRRPSISRSTSEGSASVEVSPSES